MSKFKETSLKSALINLAATVAGMVGHIEEQLVNAIEGLFENNPSKFSVALGHTPQVRRLTNEVIQRVIETIVIFKPKNEDVKMIMSSWKIASSLERITLLIHEAVLTLNGHHSEDLSGAKTAIQNICDGLMAQMYDIVIAYTTDKTDIIENIILKEQRIGGVYRAFFRETMMTLIEKPALIGKAEIFLSGAKSFEMIGRYMCEIAEQLKYKNMNN